MFWTHWNLSALRSFCGLPASGSETEYISNISLICTQKLFAQTDHLLERSTWTQDVSLLSVQPSNLQHLDCFCCCFVQQKDRDRSMVSRNSPRRVHQVHNGAPTTHNDRLAAIGSSIHNSKMKITKF
jgi:hypothetical protein